MTASPAGHTDEAAALFERFARRHGLSYHVNEEAPVELCWMFPRQEKLSIEITLALQNGDELNLGVDRFWSYFFPFDVEAGNFEAILDAWVAGEARILEYAFGTRVLQMRQDGFWQGAYRAGNLWPFRGWLTNTLQNQLGG